MGRICFLFFVLFVLASWITHDPPPKRPWNKRLTHVFRWMDPIPEWAIREHELETEKWKQDLAEWNARQ